MSVLNIRDVDEKLHQAMKAKALGEGVPLRSWVLAACRSALDAGLSVPPAAVVPVVERTKKEAGADLPAVTQAARPGHDPKTCRVYRCNLCASGGHRDPHRGL